MKITPRKLIQAAILFIFLLLFINTEYTDTDILTLPVNIFLKLDPLVFIGVSLSAREVITPVFYSLAIILATIIFGRFFCGWICPLGAIIDLFDWLILKRKKELKKWDEQSLKKWKYYLLIFIIATSLVSVQFLWFFDPLSILIRSLTVAYNPLFNLIINAFFDLIYSAKIPLISPLADSLHQFFKDKVLSYSLQIFYQSLPIFLVFMAIILLSQYKKRFWCRYLCPLGALLGLFSALRAAKRDVSQQCNMCLKCQKDCKMGAISEEIFEYAGTECINCFDCQYICPQKAITFKFKRSEVKNSKIDLQRRAVLSSLVGGIAFAGLVKLDVRRENIFPQLIRPPGSLKESDFLDRCTRCGECMKVCPMNALQPAIFQAGIEGIWTPVLIPKIGYCEFNCTLCGQVCPTGAIRHLPLFQKRVWKIGVAYFIKDLCLPYAKNINCSVCEEHCPTPDKAIKFNPEIVFENGEEKIIKKPYVIDDLCIGCGICEFKCPLYGQPGVVITNRIETRRDLGGG